VANYPNDRRYTQDHEWAKLEDDVVRIGITHYAVEQLGDVTLIDLPEPGSSLEATAHFGDIESVKAVSELFSPISGEVVEVNEALEDSPELINDAPYSDGWMMRVRIADGSELDELMDSQAYEKFLDTLDH
jgi:glycine cleavage system H protein